MKLKAHLRSLNFIIVAILSLTVWAISCRGPNTQALPTLAATSIAALPATATQETAVPTKTPPPPTKTPTSAYSPTPGPSPTSTNTPPPPATPTSTLTPSATPTSLPQSTPVLTVTAPEEFLEGIPTPSTAIPTAVPTFEVPSDTTNVLLLGSDTPLKAGGDTRTDTMIIVAVNRSTETASMISLPRDLFVYIPGKTMGRLNTALSLGGVELLKQTILYNFGVPIHYYARIDFNGFQTAVDAMDGVDVAVSCRLQDWRLISPELDPQDEDNWHQFALEPGIHHMDGDLALWYARSRLSSSDFERGRRQQQLLRAMLNQGVDLGLLSQFPTLWEAYKDNVETDMDIGRILQLATLAPAIRENGVQHLYLARGVEPWETPGGAQVQIPLWEGENNLEETFSRLFRAPALNRATRRPITVEIVNATDNPDLAQLAADNLAWYGFIPIIAPDQPQPDSVTQLSYYRPNFKDSYDWLISWIFGLRRSEIELAEDDAFTYDYRVFLGEDYDPCLNQLFQPQEFLN